MLPLALIAFHCAPQLPVAAEQAFLATNILLKAGAWDGQASCPCTGWAGITCSGDSISEMWVLMAVRKIAASACESLSPASLRASLLLQRVMHCLLAERSQTALLQGSCPLGGASSLVCLPCECAIGLQYCDAACFSGLDARESAHCSMCTAVHACAHMLPTLHLQGREQQPCSWHLARRLVHAGFHDDAVSALGHADCLLAGCYACCMPAALPGQP